MDSYDQEEGEIVRTVPSIASTSYVKSTVISEHTSTSTKYHREDEYSRPSRDRHHDSHRSRSHYAPTSLTSAPDRYHGRRSRKNDSRIFSSEVDTHQDIYFKDDQDYFEQLDDVIREHEEDPKRRKYEHRSRDESSNDKSHHVYDSNHSKDRHPSKHRHRRSRHNHEIVSPVKYVDNHKRLSSPKNPIDRVLESERHGDDSARSSGSSACDEQEKRARLLDQLARLEREHQRPKADPLKSVVSASSHLKPPSQLNSRASSRDPDLTRGFAINSSESTPLSLHRTILDHADEDSRHSSYSRTKSVGFPDQDAISDESLDVPATNDSLSNDHNEPATEELNENSLNNGNNAATLMKPAEELPVYYPGIFGCRSVEEFEHLNKIEEGTYGVVFRAKDKRTGELVALKKLKMEKEREGFPITSLREISTLMKAAEHPNVVKVLEIVYSNPNKIYIVMEYLEHDLKALMTTMSETKKHFLPGEVKTLMLQLLSAVEHLHDNWILHRDLKTSNLLLNHRGMLKVADFGLAREYGSPIKPYTSCVVTLWYRAPELLLQGKRDQTDLGVVDPFEYSTPIDIWSVGCIMAEFLLLKPLFPGKSEIEQVKLIFKELGTPGDKIWSGYSNLRLVKLEAFDEHPYNSLPKRFESKLSSKGVDLLNRFLTYSPEKRITATEALRHDFFKEHPLPIDPSMFPTWPSTSERNSAKGKGHSPRAPEGGNKFALLSADERNAVSRLRNPRSATNALTAIALGHHLSDKIAGYSIK